MIQIFHKNQMIREITRPPTALCTLPQYIGFLLSEPRTVSCSRVGEVLEISHDSVNRFLYRETYTPIDLFNEAKSSLDLIGGVVSVDDSVLDKPYSKHIELVSHFYSGKHHAVVKGLNLITLYYTDPKGHHLPINFRIYDKSEGKTKNDYFLDMLKEVIEWGLSPIVVTGDSWYSSVNNLKTIRECGLGLMFAVEANRTISEVEGTWVQVQKIDIPEDGLIVWLKDFGRVKVFRTFLKDQKRHYVISLPEDIKTDKPSEKLESFSFNEFEKWHDDHWKIEQFHRAIKQVCNIERFQVRGKIAIHTHVFASICGFVELQKMCAVDLIKNCYAVQRNLFNDVISQFVNIFSPRLERLKPHFSPSINA
tara:strand:+ start:93 stop:1187 length:1095 start_codon:yes stop_codon:yes gene_type:complete